MRDIQADVREFMAAFKQEMHDTPQWPDQDTMDLRVRLKAEEFCEWLRDSGYEGNLWIGRYDPTLPGCSETREVFCWGYEPSTEDAIHVVLWMEEHGVWPDEIYIHSMNQAGRERMADVMRKNNIRARIQVALL